MKFLAEIENLPSASSPTNVVNCPWFYFKVRWVCDICPPKIKKKTQKFRPDFICGVHIEESDGHAWVPGEVEAVLPGVVELDVRQPGSALEPPVPGRGLAHQHPGTVSVVFETVVVRAFNL